MYRTIIPVEQNIIPLSGFPDRLTNRIITFIEIVYGTETLDENLRFIADSLGGDGEPAEIIERYLLKDFFPDHCKIYHKRPVYWMFDSGRKCHFKALCYMHRWSSEVPLILREKYVLPYMDELQVLSDKTMTELKETPSAEKPKIKRKIAKYTAQYEEMRLFAEKLFSHNEDIELDDGVKVNYNKFEDVLEKIKYQ